MNERQRKFCDCYLANGRNATQAYLEAGYKPKDENAAAVNASKLLRSPKVQEYLGNCAEALKAKAEHEAKLMTVEETAMLMSRIANGITEGDEEAPSWSDRLKAIDMYGKYLNMFSTNVNVKTSEPIVIHNNVTE